MNPQEIFDAIKETRLWAPSDETSMQLRALYSMGRRRLGQVEYKPDIWLDLCDMKTPTRSDQAWHIFFHKWLHYDDNNVFDGSKQICLICGKSESSPMKRDYGYEPNGYDDLNLRIVLDFIADLEEITKQ